MNIYYLMKNQQKLTTEIIDLEIAGTKVHNVDFFGTKINLIPLVFYCLFHLMLYTFYYYTEYELSDYLQQIFQNGFLTTLYVVLTLTLLEYGISKIIKLQLEIWWNVMRRIKNSIVRQYDNNKLQGI